MQSQGEHRDENQDVDMPVGAATEGAQSESMAEHFMMTPERASASKSQQGSPISDESFEFATDEMPRDAMNRELFAPMDSSSPASSRGAKKQRVTPVADVYVDDRMVAQTHSRQSSDMGSPALDGDAKRARGDDDAMGELKILSAVLRGVDITEVYSP